MTPIIRDRQDSNRINALNQVLSQANISEPVKQTAFLAHVVERLLSYHSLAQQGAQWSNGISWVLQLLDNIQAQARQSPYQAKLSSLTLGLLTCLYPPERADFTYTRAENLNEQCQRWQENQVQAFQGLVELTYAIKHERDPVAIEAMLSAAAALLQVSPVAQRNAALDDLTDLITGAYVEQLRLNRQACYNDSTDILVAQQADSEVVNQWLRKMWGWTETLLGTKMVETALLLLGSTSRGERGPHSDIECALLVSSQATGAEKAYIHARLRLLDILVIRLNQTPIMTNVNDRREGIRLDVSTVVTGDPLHTALMSVGTVDDFFEHQLTPVIEGRAPVAHNANYFSLLYAKPIVTDTSGAELFQQFQTRLQVLIKQPVCLEAYVWKNIPLQRLTGWVVYQSILEDAIAEWHCAQQGEGFSFKKLILSPCQYLARFLELQHGVTFTSDTRGCLTSHERLPALVAQGLLPIGFSELWLAVLGRMSQVRHGIDEAAHGQCDKISLAELSPMDSQGIALFVDTVLSPLCEQMKTMLTQVNFPTSEQAAVTLDLLRPFLNARRRLWEDAPAHWILPCLADYPSDDGWSPRAADTHHLWQATAAKALFNTSGVATRYLVQGGDWGATV